MNENIVRPMLLSSEIYRIRVDEDKWIVIISLLNGEPFELFTIEDNSTIEINVINGDVRITKNEFYEPQFNFEYINSQGKLIKIADISKNKNREFGNYGLFITAMLQDKKPISYIIRVLDKLEPDNDRINSWMFGVKRALKKYIPDGKKIYPKECPNCRNNAMLYNGGCSICTECGWSECG